MKQSLVCELYPAYYLLIFLLIIVAVAVFIIILFVSHFRAEKNPKMLSHVR